METKIKEKRMRKCIFEKNPEEVENIYITGWILHFYNEYRIKEKDISDLIPEIVEVPINIKKIDAFDNNNKKKCIIYAGIRDIKQDPYNYEVEPIVNYEFTFDENQKEFGKKVGNKKQKEDLNDSEDIDIGFLFS